MVTINTTDDLLHALAENPRWKEAVRLEILTEELRNLPARFGRFVATTEAFMEEQRQVNANTAEFIAEQRETNARMEGHITHIYQTVNRIREDTSTSSCRQITLAHSARARIWQIARYAAFSA